MGGHAKRFVAFLVISILLCACSRVIDPVESSSEQTSSKVLPSIFASEQEDAVKIPSAPPALEEQSSSEEPSAASEYIPPMEPFDDVETIPDTEKKDEPIPEQNSSSSEKPKDTYWWVPGTDIYATEPPDEEGPPFEVEEQFRFTPTLKDNPISTTVSIKVVDTAGNPIPNVSVTPSDQTRISSPNGHIYFFDVPCWQGYPTDHSGETTFPYDARWISSVMFELTPFQENCKGIDFAHRKRERFQFDLTRAEVQPQVTVTMTGEYSWPGEPTMEITLLHQDGTPCVDYWCILGRPSSGGTSTSQGTGKLNGNGYTDENGKLIFYGTKVGKWSLMTERSEHFRSDGYYNHLQRFEFEVKSIEDENHFVFVVND